MTIVANPQMVPQNGTDTMNNAANAGINNDKDRYNMEKYLQSIQQQYAQAQEERQQLMRGLLGGINQGFANSDQMRGSEALLGYKSAYQQADDYMNQLAAAYDNADTDDVRANISQEMDKTRNYMGEMAKGANLTRDYYNRQGIDLSRYGSDISLADASLNYAEDYNKGLKRILNPSRTPDDVYEDEYATLRKNGATREYARKAAGKAAAKYQAQMLADYQSGIRDYGYSSDGSYNDYALQILGMMKNYDPELANMMLGANASPKDAWNIAQGRENAAIAHEYDKDKMGYGNQLQQGNMMLGNNLGMDMAKLQHILGLEKMGAQYGYGQMAADNEMSRRLKMDDANYANAVSRLYNAFIADGMSEGEAMRNALSYASGIKGGKNDKASPQEAKMNVALQQLFSGNGSIKEYEKDIAGLINYMDDETKQYMTSDVKYLYNAVNQWRHYPSLDDVDGKKSDTRVALENIRNSPRLVEEFEKLTGTKFPLKE